MHPIVSIRKTQYNKIMYRGIIVTLDRGSRREYIYIYIQCICKSHVVVVIKCLSPIAHPQTIRVVDRAFIAYSGERSIYATTHKPSKYTLVQIVNHKSDRIPPRAPTMFALCGPFSIVIAILIIAVDLGG